MKITTPLSAITLKSKEQQIQNAKEALEYSPIVTNSIMENMPKETDYKKLRFKARKYSKSQLDKMKERLNGDSKTNTDEIDTLLKENKTYMNQIIQFLELLKKREAELSRISRRTHDTRANITTEEKGDVDIGD